MSPWTFIWRSLSHHWRINVAVALGVAAATAVLTGALLVGDSVRGSLRRLVLNRLGQIDHILVTDRFFRAALPNELAAHADFQRDFHQATGVILLPGGTLERSQDGQAHRAANVLVLGGDDSFWKLGKDGPRPTIESNEIVLNEPLADELDAAVGDEVLLRLPHGNQVPADSPLGKKTDRIRTVTGLKVKAIIPAEGLGRFSLRSSQQTSKNAYVTTATLQDALNQPDKINAVMVAERSTTPRPEATTALRALLSLELADFGIQVDHIQRKFQPTKNEPEQVAYEYINVSTDRLVFSDANTKVVEQALAEWSAQPVITQLATGIQHANAPPRGDKVAPVIPYSMITAVDSRSDLGPLLGADGQSLGKLRDDQIVLNSWAAADLDVKVGDVIRVSFFEPETAHGQAVERSVDFSLHAIVPITEPADGYRRKVLARFDQRPTLANDADLTPTVDGVTDQDSIDQWDPPFPFEQSRMREEDDRYWQNYRTTPKAFVSFATGRRLWHSRFGSTTSYRLPLRDGVTLDVVRKRLLAALRSQQVELGFDFLPVKQRSLAAASGTTPFDGLFLGLSLFIIVAALLLVAILFRLGLEQRAAEVGVLQAVGFPQKRAAALFVREATVVAMFGGVVGVLLGIGYAWLMLVGLRTWWLGAVATPFLQLYVTSLSLIIGFLSGLIVSAAVIVWSLRATRQVSIRSLLSGCLASAVNLSAPARRRTRILVIGLLVMAVALGIGATRLSGEAQAGVFVTAGMAVLVALLLWLWSALKGGTRQVATGGLSLSGLMLRNAGRNPSRSTLTIGLMAVACFLIISMSAFRLDPSSSGAGGFSLIAESSQPIFDDLNREETRRDLFAQEKEKLAGSQIFSLRMKPGDDASCNNLYQASQPRVLGVPTAFTEHFDSTSATPFAWAGNAATSAENSQNPWRLLASETTETGAIPVVLDKNTALYSLHLYGGIGQEFSVDYERSGPVKFRVVGLLSNSVLQGSLLVSEANFVRLFPDVAGYRFFLANTPADKEAVATTLLEERLGDQGFDATSTRQVLTSLLAVQNTYLSTFQSLGALGLLLGTFGLATVQLRNVFERRAELALLRATGFSRQRLARMVLGEHLLLLVAGLAIGGIAAAVAVFPHALAGGATIPWRDLVVMIGAVLVVGGLSGLAPFRATWKAPLVRALRGE